MIDGKRIARTRIRILTFNLVPRWEALIETMDGVEYHGVGHSITDAIGSASRVIAYVNGKPETWERFGLFGRRHIT